MNILAIDTAANLCSACVYDDGRDAELGRSVLDIGTGHAERLMEVVAGALARAGRDYGDLGAIAVSVGPGSFTGVRVGVAAARGLALALKIPATGVTTLEALAEEARAAFPGRPVLAAIDARRDEIYAASYDSSGFQTVAPMVTTIEEMARLAVQTGPVLTGSAEPMISQSLAGTALDIASTGATADILAFARLAARKGAGQDKPKPLYLRAADAKPQAGFALPRAAG